MPSRYQHPDKVFRGGLGVALSAFSTSQQSNGDLSISERAKVAMPGNSVIRASVVGIGGPSSLNSLSHGGARGRARG